MSSRLLERRHAGERRRWPTHLVEGRASPRSWEIVRAGATSRGRREARPGR
jgi:hypothetical protein